MNLIQNFEFNSVYLFFYSTIDLKLILVFVLYTECVSKF